LIASTFLEKSELNDATQKLPAQNSAAPANSMNVQNASHLAACHKQATACSKEIVDSATGSISRIVTLTAALQI
jgi:hypothetical protein